MSSGKKGKTLVRFLRADDLAKLADPDYHRVKKLPGSGRYLREDNLPKQISLENLP